MPIVETKIAVRPNITIPFFSQTDLPSVVAVREAFGTITWIVDTELYQKGVYHDGAHIIERFYSEDLLTQTSKVTFDSLETWSTVDTAVGIELDKDYVIYTRENEFIAPTSGQYTLTGIDVPFTCTTTYNYDSDTVTKYPLFNDGFINVIESSDKLTAFTNTGTQLIATHTYDNADDFTENCWRDISFVTSLYEGGVTRTIAYAMV
jgi:hypothetical protein